MLSSKHKLGPTHAEAVVSRITHAHTHCILMAHLCHAFLTMWSVTVSLSLSFPTHARKNGAFQYRGISNTCRERGGGEALKHS